MCEREECRPNAVCTLEATHIAQAEVCEAICGKVVCAAIGAPNADALRVHLVNLAGAAEVDSKPAAGEQTPQAGAECTAAQQADRRLIQVRRPSSCKDRQSPVCVCVKTL